ncbi:type II toxin-antitoxin system ParD family antitoxin [Rhodospirillum rubrum]|uniref:Predicted transcriptional regulators containing the CopG/Arc/MetJ DNA-binding domain n=1 Tax=Rhodospirillum rubrum (strain ATCC 11170 / ATH 1.1.1 / DSM 467 / LMG 4362 / NCIMB 8255 / S1) TaxID=269796 RepID=Q2RNG4_RHORT|nr:type II toxin-antitoxin system ParD family antitoxin [Rhodospirillum rubrum]ABC24331.1 Predicted transcriptional regulators containing the CopG/Arc/MetJ DNA-binding domain [Rhodospirillum rubrum ATCC 11170]AEO50082.1 transcription regulator [Rhodospirillum rubrum F11]MBK5956049.1 transcriptional regulator [Rhodospirillum rubrum]QXG80258.1 type II toxin-antitoxin system ParD family antitoxin [Rhodospirillum rubrum]HAQ00234.1 type II toxin-antitoxin system ParD family antitoxin [Rhodospirillu
MPTRTVVLTERHEKLIAELVGSGRYQNASEVLRDGLRLIEERAAREAAKLKALREAAQIGLSDLDEGRFRDVADGDLDAVIGDLGRQAVARVRHRRNI